MRARYAKLEMTHTNMDQIPGTWLWQIIYSFFPGLPQYFKTCHTSWYYFTSSLIDHFFQLSTEDIMFIIFDREVSSEYTSARCEMYYRAYITASGFTSAQRKPVGCCQISRLSVLRSWWVVDVTLHYCNLHAVYCT